MKSMDFGILERQRNWYKQCPFGRFVKINYDSICQGFNLVYGIAGCIINSTF